MLPLCLLDRLPQRVAARALGDPAMQLLMPPGTVTGGKVEDYDQGPRRITGLPSTRPPLMLPIVLCVSVAARQSHQDKPATVTLGSGHSAVNASSLHALDQRLLAVPRRVQRLLFAFTVITMVWVCLPFVPRQYIDFRHLPLLGHIPQEETYGTDSLSDSYGARVVLNDISDMYTKERLEQTPLEARTWSKEASAPYPPLVLLAEACLYALGASMGVGFYGIILGLACLFLALSARYFLNTRWYLFPILYLNFSYFGYRFVHVQDSTYVVMLVVIMAALWLARVFIGAPDFFGHRGKGEGSEVPGESHLGH